MKYLFLLLFLASPASAVDWYVFTSTQPNENRLTQMYTLTPEQHLVEFATTKRLNFACGVTAENVWNLGEELDKQFGNGSGYALKGYTISSRELRCLMKDKSLISLPVSCNKDGDDFKMTDLYIENKKVTYYIQVQCLSPQSDKPVQEQE